jgi:phosphoribosylformylglycinamidine (FGAM) synthase-like enzyme
VLLGTTREELGGSEWLHLRRGLEAGTPPTVDLPHERRLQRLLAEEVGSGLVCSAHDVGSGGLAVALAECGFTGPAGVRVGAVVELADGIRPDALLFGESTGRVLVATGNCDAFLERARATDVPARRIGTTGGSRLVIRAPGTAPWIDVELADIEAVWARAIPRRLEQS